MHGASKESLLPAERHPGSEPVQTWQRQRGQASPAVLPSTSFWASPECFGEPPHYRINVGQTYYTHSRAHSFLPGLSTHLPHLAQVGKTMPPILSGHGGSSQEHPWKITHAQQFIVYETLFLSMSSNETLNILVGRDSPILQIERLRLRVRKIK